MFKVLVQVLFGGLRSAVHLRHPLFLFYFHHFEYCDKSPSLADKRLYLFSFELDSWGIESRMSDSQHKLSSLNSRTKSGKLAKEKFKVINHNFNVALLSQVY
jgi:hypothetical protein